ITQLRQKIEDFRANIIKIPTLADLTSICAVAFAVTAVGHLGADTIAPFISTHAPELSKLSLDSPFFWIIVIATTGGLLLSFTKVRNLEGAGASKVGSLFLYV